jgi:hypothetical protein
MKYGCERTKKLKQPSIGNIVYFPCHISKINDLLSLIFFVAIFFCNSSAGLPKREGFYLHVEFVDTLRFTAGLTLR